MLQPKHQIYSLLAESTPKTKLVETAVTNARFCYAPRAAGRPCLPLDHARSATQTRALVTSDIR